jgi:hypothetical protein
MSKGDWRRPAQVDAETYDERWAKAFGTTTEPEPRSAPVPNMTCLRCGGRFWHHQWTRCPECYGTDESNRPERYDE